MKRQRLKLVPYSGFEEARSFEFGQGAFRKDFTNQKVPKKSKLPLGLEKGFSLPGNIEETDLMTILEAKKSRTVSNNLKRASLS